MAIDQFFNMAVVRYLGFWSFDAHVWTTLD